jgi:indolepyruvate ferredoxin oxidoreductase beta subunit
VAYAREYIGQMQKVYEIDSQYCGDKKGFPLTNEVGRYLALWMSYEDSIRVADLKTRASRFERLRREVGASPGQIVKVSEFMRPRVEELCDVMPARLGKIVRGSNTLRKLFGVFCNKGRQIHTTELPGFLLLYWTSRLRRFRRGTYRFAVERARIEQWLTIVTSVAAEDYDLAVEIAECPRLIKGYGETHERGLKSFERILAALDRVRSQQDASASINRLRHAALADEHGIALDEALSQLN